MRKSVLSRYIDPDVLALVADRHFEPRDLIVGNLAGAHKSPLSGFAVEFAGHREYVPGDDPKHVDWRVYFNRDKYFVKQYELETNFVCHLLLDVSASMRYGEEKTNKLAYAARMATTLGFSVIRQSDKVSFTTFDEQVRGFVPPSHTMEQVLRIADEIERVEATQKTRLGNCLNELAGRLGRRGIVMIFSDLFGDLSELEQAIQRLRYDQHEVILFHILHHDEMTFEFDGQARFLGLETNDDLRLRIDDVRASYLASFVQFRNRLDEIAKRSRCEYAVVDTKEQLADVLTAYLNQRSGAM
jgi:uncharacterized protein (DUF58 family)